MAKPKKKLTQSEIAEIWNVGQKAISDWFSKGLDPLDDVDGTYHVVSKMRHKNLRDPVAIKRMIAIKLQERSGKKTSGEPGSNPQTPKLLDDEDGILKGVFTDDLLESSGADASLRRAAALELRMAQEVSRTGNIHLLKAYSDQLSAFRQLKRDESKWEQDTGVLIKKEVVVNLCNMVGLALRLFEGRMLDKIGVVGAKHDDPAEIRQEIKGEFYAKWDQTLREGLEDSRFEQWMLDELTKGHTE